MYVQEFDGEMNIAEAMNQAKESELGSMTIIGVDYFMFCWSRDHEAWSREDAIRGTTSWRITDEEMVAMLEKAADDWTRGADPIASSIGWITDDGDYIENQIVKVTRGDSEQASEVSGGAA